MKNKNKCIPIFFASDNNFAKAMTVAMASILENTKSFIEFYVLENQISDEVKAGINQLRKQYKNCSVEYLKINMERFKDFPELHLTLNAYSRYLISKFKPNLKKIIYLDVDTIVNFDIQELYNINLEGNIIGAVSRHPSQLKQDWLLEHAKVLGITAENCFNSGVLLIDNQKWVENNITEKLFKKTYELLPVLKFADQDVLNVIFADKFKKLDYKYNTLSYLAKSLIEENPEDEIKNFKIIHYADKKPWLSPDVFGSEYFWKYARMTIFFDDFLGKNSKTIHIGFTISNNYSCHLATTMASILHNAKPDDNLHFYILNAGDISEENKRRIDILKSIKDFSLDYVKVNNSEFEKYVTGCHISTNYRLKIASFMPNLDKILFLDVDTIVCESLLPLWQEDITNYYMAAAINPCIKAEIDYVKEDAHLLPEKPFNTGVTLINLKKWREDNIETKLLETINWYSTRHQRVPDQNAMNIVMKNKIKEIPQKYNACPILAFVQKEPWNYDDKEMLKQAFEKPAILHYASAREFKVWDDSSLPYADFYWKYLKMTPYHKEMLNNLKTLKRPCLPRLEIHIVDHCNLNCRGCTHFCNIAPKKFTDINVLSKDLLEISTKLEFGEIKLLGGEPLLHPDIHLFFYEVRKIFPTTKIILTSNLILLDKMDDRFWEGMKANDIRFQLTKYPPLNDKFQHYIDLINKKGIIIDNIHVADEFWLMRNPKGDSNPQEIYSTCCEAYCRQLRNGRLYICPDACYMDYYNKYFKKNIPVDKGIDIYTNTGEQLYQYLTIPKETCKYCGPKKMVKWQQSKKQIDEWNTDIKDEAIHTNNKKKSFLKALMTIKILSRQL